MQKHYVLCDGGLGNRLNALIFALVLVERYGGEWSISWPLNNWCGANFEDLFECAYSVNCNGIDFYKDREQGHILLMHENQIGFDSAQFVNNRGLDHWSEYDKIFETSQSIVYYNNIIPPFVGPDELGRALAQLAPAEKPLISANNFCTAHHIDKSVMGLHIRKTDFGGRVDDNALYDLVRLGNHRYFICSDSREVNERFGALPNCVSFEKSAYPEKLVKTAEWQSWIRDDSGRHQPYNITRPRLAVIEGLIDLLILSRTRIVLSSDSTFLNMARIFSLHSFSNNRFGQ